MPIAIAVRRLGRRRVQAGDEVFLVEPIAHGGQEQRIQSARVAETDLRLGRMYVDIDMVGREIEEQKRDRITARHQQAAIALLHGMSERAVADPPAVEKEVLALGVAAVA